MTITGERWPLWVVVVGGADARFYRLDDRKSDLELLDTLHNQQATLREQDRMADKPGRSYDSFGAGRHSMEPRQTQKRIAARNFAERIAAELINGHERQLYRAFALIAPPRMLGALRDALPQHLNPHAAAVLDKDLSAMAPDALRKRVDEVLARPPVP